MSELRECAPVVWLTGLSGAGKSTLAQALASRLRGLGTPSIVIDGDVLRGGLCRDLGFSDSDRRENTRRATELAKLASDSGVLAIVALISPFRQDRDAARVRLSPARFLEVYVDAPLALIQERDPKGLYAQVRQGQLSQFTGFDSPYEAPLSPELHIDTSASTVADAVGRIEQQLRR